MFGALSILLHKPWRRRFDKRRPLYHQSEQRAETVGMTTEAVHVPVEANEHGSLDGGSVDIDRSTTTVAHAQGKS